MPSSVGASGISLDFQIGLRKSWRNYKGNLIPYMLVEMCLINTLYKYIIFVIELGALKFMIYEKNMVKISSSYQ